MINFYDGTRLLGGKTAPVQQPAAALTPAPAPVPSNGGGFGEQMNALATLIRSSSDGAGVMQAAFQALSLMKPDLAKSLANLPADQQTQVLTAYANAVRNGQQFSAHEAAAGEFAKVKANAAAATNAPNPLGIRANPLELRSTSGSGGDPSASASPTSGSTTSSGMTGIGVGGATDAIQSAAVGAAKDAAMAPSMTSLATGLIGGPMASAALAGYNAYDAYSSTKDGMTADALSAVNASPDPIGALNTMQGWTGTSSSNSPADFGPYGGGDYSGYTTGSDTNNTSNEAGPGPGSESNTDASSADATNGSDSQSDAASASSESSSDSSDGGYAKGGKVTKDRLRGPNPKGKDDGYAALDAGEFVLKADAVKRIGVKALQALNDGRARIVMN